MAALVLNILDSAPLVVAGSERKRVYSISGTVNTDDVATITEFSSVSHASFIPATAAGAGIAFSGAGDRTLTIKLTASCTGGRLIVWGF